MGFFDRYKQRNREKVHEDFDKGAASFRDEEGDRAIPTMIDETSLTMADADATATDAAQVEKLAPGTSLATDVAAQAKRAADDMEAAKAVLADAQQASDDADAKEGAMRGPIRTQFAGNLPAPGSPADPGDAALSAVTSDNDRIEKDMGTASSALADADAAKKQADEDVARARQGATEPPTGE